MAGGEQGGSARGLDPKRDWAVVVVHGIGSTEPMDLLERVTRAIGSQRLELDLDPHYQVIHPGPKSSARGAAAGPGILGKIRTVQKEFFSPSRRTRAEPAPRHARVGRLGSSKVTFATAHWSDIARVGESLGSVVAGLLLSGLGVRNFANVSTDSERQPLSRLLHLVLELMIYLLALVYLPLVIASAIFGGAGLLSFYLIYGKLQWIQPWFTALVSVGVAGTIAYFGIRYFWPRRKERSFGWRIFVVMLMFTLLASALLVVGHLTIVDPGKPLDGLQPRIVVGLLETYGELTENPQWITRVRLLDETGIYFGLMQLLQLVVSLVLILLAVIVLVLLPLVWLTATRDQFRGALLGTVCVISMWALLLLVLWPENLLTTAALSWYSVPPQARGMLPPTHAFVFVPISTFPFVWLESLSAQDLGVGTLAYRLYPLLWHDLVFFAFLVLAALVFGSLAAIRWIWCRVRAHLKEEPAIAAFGMEPGQKRPRLSSRPRLIVAWTYSGLVLLFMIVVCGIVLAQFPIVQRGLGLTGLREIPQELHLLTPIVTVPVVAALIGFVLLAHWIREAVKLVLDVVNHFAAPSHDFPIRQQIAARFDEALQLAVGTSDKPHLVVIAHSQGTVVALDRLFGSAKQPGIWENGVKGRVSSLTVLTFGSPMSHIYQQYFGHIYRPFSEMPGYSGARSDPSVLWVNSYRIDDYIGTWIENSIERFPLNLPMPIGGHTNYWEGPLFARLFARPEMADVLVAAKVGSPAAVARG